MMAHNPTYSANFRNENFSQVVVVPACIVPYGLKHTTAKEVNEYVRKAIPAMKHDLVLIGDVQTTHENGDGTMRIDMMLLIHNEDIGAFAHARFGLDMPFRWLEDVLGNDMERGAQTYSRTFLRHYPPTWEYGATKWQDYPCYIGDWAGDAQ